MSDKSFKKEILDNLPQMIIFLDDEGHVKYANKKFYEFVGLSEDEVIDVVCGNVLNCAHVEDDEKGCGFGDFCKRECGFRKVLSETIKEKKKVSYEYKFESKLQSDPIYLDIHSLPKGEFTDNYVLVTINDISELKRAESLNLKKEKLKTIEAYNEELKKIIQIASHDFKSPIYNISGFVRNILDDFKEMSRRLEGENPSIEIKNILKEYDEVAFSSSEKYLKQSIVRLNTLLEGLLKLAQLGALKPDLKEFDVKSLVSEIKEDIDSKDLELKTTNLNNCLADYSLLRVIFSNLIENALKYKKRGSKALVEVSSQIEDGKVIYEIKDNGVGIPSIEHNKVFDLFYQSDPNVNDGKGMGLSLVKWATLKLGGEVTFKSEEGSGTTFFLSIPK